MLAAFAALALYTFGKAMYYIGRNDGSRMEKDHAGQVELSVKPDNNHNVIPYLYGTTDEEIENKKREQGGSRQRQAEKERKPLTEAQRLRRQKMIVLPAMVLVFIGAMWLIFAPSSGKEQEPVTGGYKIEMPDADKENRRIIGDKAKAYEQGAMEERQENRSRAMQQLGDLFDRETAAADRDSDSTLPIRRNGRGGETRTEDHPVLGSRLP